jgi:hypothetical protein
MLNPYASQPDSDFDDLKKLMDLKKVMLQNSYFDLKKRMLQKVQEAQVNDQIFEVVQKAYEEALAAENIVLSRPERKRLLAQILKLVLENMLKKMDDRSSSK